MLKRGKILKNTIESLEYQKQLHPQKIETEKGRKDTTKDYWRKELEKFEREIEKKKRKLKY